MPPSLAALRPRGLNTGHVESLTSYFCGLAYEHSVLTFNLIGYLSSQGSNLLGLGRALRHLNSMNGYGAYSKRFTGRISEIKLISDSALLTCLPWGDAFNPRGHTLLHKSKAWCDDCWQEDRRQGKRTYQRLYWCLGSTSMCVLHRKAFTTVCPSCGLEQPQLPKLPFIDCCNYCGADLVSENSESTYPSHEQIWDTESTVDFINATHKDGTRKLNGDDIKDFVEAVVNKVAGGSVTKLANMTGIERASIRGWVSGQYRPSFVQFIRFCRAVRCPPSALVTGFPLFIDPELIVRCDDAPLRKVLNGSESDFDNLKRRLENLVENSKDRPLSLKRIAQRLGCSVSRLRYRYPELSRIIIKKAAEFRAVENNNRKEARTMKIVHAVETCIKNAIYPSDRHLRAVYGVHPSDLRSLEIREFLNVVRNQIRTGHMVSNESLNKHFPLNDSNCYM